MSETKFATKKDANNAGWYSRRHETNGARMEARAVYGTRAERRMRRQVSAQARDHVCSLMHPQARLMSLDSRPGNSTKERAKLKEAISNGEA